MCNFSQLSGLSKFVLMFDMLAGRLEIFPMLILFHRLLGGKGGEMFYKSVKSIAFYTKSINIQWRQRGYRPLMK